MQRCLIYIVSSIGGGAGGERVPGRRLRIGVRLVGMGMLGLAGSGRVEGGSSSELMRMSRFAIFTILTRQCLRMSVTRVLTQHRT